MTPRRVRSPGAAFLVVHTFTDIAAVIAYDVAIVSEYLSGSDG